MRKSDIPEFFGRSRDELKQLLVEELSVSETFRADQLCRWLYARRAKSFAEMSDLPLKLIRSLNERFKIPSLSVRHESVSEDGTRKYLFDLKDGFSIETVLIPSEMRDADGGARRKTLCVSTQVGCPLDCKFCATASLKLKRNLTTAEILLQIFEVERLTGESITNLVFMGMGEPMLNYDNLVRALRIITDPATELLGKRRITVSTSGIPDAIRKFAREGLGVKLALSLHATTNELRTRLMPINKRYPLEEVLSAMQEYYTLTRIPITYEYILFKGLNDSEADAKRLAKITRRMPSKVNVIPFHEIDFTNPTGFGATLRPANNRDFAHFLAMLKREGVQVMVRSSSGQDIEAACGQLALAELKQNSAIIHDIALPAV
ncbi:MAG TPA: 23S rRNA (adenine(2503)-C(2))-methyltransferase RlmN [Candidatus Kapabacteria bacterium]|jgi:23S rRNA (adenine2503-C2)-methyltransferase|nr:23S rRNA (adenine(2503)-C(2))-methyltransferase RlmN [Candidatus Kapabacteria bacterium]